jgi:haloalkane dehalogenase
MSDTAQRRPPWVDARLFPFESRFLEVDGNLVHYVDEGEGPVLLMLHGNPTWGFLFRDLIAGLRDRFRCVAPDLPGFGLSRARAGYGFTPAEHAEVIRRFVSDQDLHGMTLFVQDWGGPIGLHAVSREPHRCEALVIGNTWAWPVDTDPHFTRFSRIMGGPVGRLAIRHANAFVNLLVPAGHRRRRLSGAEMAMYRRPFPTRASRMPTNVFPREILGSTAWLREVEAGLPLLAHLPALILWGARDFAFRAQERRRFEAAFPHHRTHVIAEAGHYLWADAPESVLAAFLDWRSDVAPLQMGPAATPHSIRDGGTP